MPTISSDARFLGVDLHAVWRAAVKGWQALQKRPPLAWINPSIPVRLIQVDGQKTLWLHGKLQSGRGSMNVSVARCVALELPETLVLRRTLNLPPMSESDIASAVALDVKTSSPFGAQDVIWGYSVVRGGPGAVNLDIALASRKQVEQYLASQKEQLTGEPIPEVWVRSVHGPAIVMAGYGETLRARIENRWRAVGYGLLLLALFWLLAMAVTPTAQLRLRAIEAVNAYGEVFERARPVVAQREELLQAVEQLNILSDIMGRRIDPLRLMHRLTIALPDDTALQSVKLQADKVTIVGLTGNASALMQILSDQPGVRDVRAPSAATRMAGALKENFMIEFVLDPQLFGVLTVAPPQPAASAVPVTAAPAVPASAASSVPSLPAASAPAGSGSVIPAAKPADTPKTNPSPAAATFGGATFGGTRPPPSQGGEPSPAKKP
ncbi:PilN domain-containing protein [Acidovorax sp. LjRoot117]|uniref:PilN domain-containing protein n=1 Tax=Acidovorax sp. LjRoot117 TaxID=3342255 RepID=UPI003ECF8469